MYGVLSVLRLASVVLNGFAGVLEGTGVRARGVLESLKAPSSSTLLAVPSDLALKGSSGASSFGFSGGNDPGGGVDMTSRVEEENSGGNPLSSSEVAEWGEIIRTVLPVFALGRGTSWAH